jgi:hypothetical protein
LGHATLYVPGTFRCYIFLTNQAWVLWAAKHVAGSSLNSALLSNRLVQDKSRNPIAQGQSQSFTM